MNKTKVMLLFSILCLFIVLPASFAVNNDTVDVVHDNGFTDYYFDANIENDTGDGSIANPYKTLTSDRIKDDSNIHLANGEYKLDRVAYVDNVNIIGSAPEKTIVSYYGKGFDLDGPFTLTNVTLVYLAIDANDQILTATNTIFKGYSSSTQSPVMCDGGVVNFNNCTFKDNSASNGGAIHMDGGKLTVSNSLFINNTASKCGGAISCENDAYAEVYNSQFENDDANSEAGGAVYLLDSLLIMNNVEINNCYAPFGGAISSLNSELNLTDFKSKNNRAKYYGGSVYSLYHTFIINYSLLINNSADLGGALFVEGVESFYIHDNLFINNTAGMGGAVYSRLSDCYYDSICNKELNNSFENNTVFETDNLNITFENDDYVMIRLNSQDIDALPSYYDLRDLGQVTPAKNQVNGGNCWAFSFLAALESSILKATNVSYDLSEENMKNLMALYSSYGWAMKTNEGGYVKMAIGYLAGWLGPVNESDDVYDARSLLSPLLASVIHVQNIAVLDRDNSTDNDAIKKAIMEYGAVATSIYWSSTNLKNGKNYYYNGMNGANHAVAIVGWDDNYDKYNFKNTPEGNGAWIIKNSHGPNSGDNGFFYVSYYDAQLAEPGTASSFAIILNNTLKYDKIYQYDVQGYTDFFLNTTNTVWYKNKFTATADEYLAAVSTYFRDEARWDLSVYVNNVLKSTKSGKSSLGYYTFDLDHLVPLKAGDVFEVVFKITVDGDAGVPISEYISLNQETYKENTSFISYDGKTWVDFYGLEWSYPDHSYFSQVASIKAFTLSDKINSDVTINVIYNKISDILTIIAWVHDEWGNVARDGSVVFTVDGNQYRSSIVNGKASINYNLNSDLHNISATFTGSDYYPSGASIQYIKPSKIEATFSIDDIEFGNDLMACINLNDQCGNVIVDYVNIKINDLTYNLIVSDNNYYKLPFNLNEGFYEAEISGNGFDGKKVNFTISKSSADLNLNIATNYDEVLITLSLSNKYNETATVNVFGKNTTVKLQNGQATIKYNTLACGNYKVNVYLSDNYLNNFQSSSFEISYKNTSLTVSDMTTYYNSGGEWNIKLIDSDGRPVSNKEIRVTVNNMTDTCLTDKNGIAVYEAYLENGVHEVNVEFGGDSYYVPSSSTAKITVLTTLILSSELTKTYGSYYTFKLLDTFGNPLKNFMIYVEFNGEKEFIESNSNGVFSLKIDKKQGNYKLVIINPVNDEEVSQTIKVVSRITDNKAVTMYYGAGKSYSVKVLDDNGNIAKGVTVTFQINGKAYTRTTDSNGYAYFKLNLNPDTYTITATYKGFKVSNKIVIKPTLIMSAKTVKKSKTFKYTVKLLDKNGKILKNKKVTVKFRGKTYSAKTNSKGIANFKVKALSKTGKFKLTASYGNAKMSKIITIKK